MVRSIFAVTGRLRRGPLVGVLLVGVGLVLAPVVFQMFDRAPKGASMINDFRPYMTVEQIDLFQGYMTEIGDAVAETEELRADLVAAGTVEEADFAGEFVLTVGFVEAWPGIDADMSDMLATMDENRGNYAAVDALPSFDLFPWFFVVPGLLIVAFASAALVLDHRRGSGSSPRMVLVGLGIAVVLAPVAFQMFSRAPDGGAMIDDFRDLMTETRVQNVQGYFVTLGTGEGEVRTAVLPLADDPDGYPAITRFTSDWPAITGDFAPMIGTMSNNVDNFEAVDALPPFPLFPWFFVIPGVLVVGLAWAAGRPPSVLVKFDNARSS